MHMDSAFLYIILECVYITTLSTKDKHRCCQHCEMNRVSLAANVWKKRDVRKKYMDIIY